jgi:hypothetical protein
MEGEETKGGIGKKTMPTWSSRQYSSRDQRAMLVDDMDCHVGYISQTKEYGPMMNYFKSL